MNAQDIAKIRPGMIIAYHLLPKDIPLNPNKVWRGKVLRYNEEFILVELLEPGYSGLTEYVAYSQLVAIEQ
jgi:hypothetical protein